MSDKLKITKLLLETKSGKEIFLELDEAEELYQQLELLFGKKETFIPLAPIVIERDKWNSPYIPRPIWCSSNTSIDQAKQLSGQTTMMKMTGDSGLTVSYVGQDV